MASRWLRGPKPDTPYNRTGIINEVCRLVCDRLEEFFDYMEVDLRLGGKLYVGRCPVHGGTSIKGFNFYAEGHTVHGYWECLSDKCHRQFVPSAVGFARGVLSHQKYEWKGDQKDRMVTHKEAMDHVLNFLDLKIEEIQYDKEREERDRFIASVTYLSGEPPTPAGVIGTRKVFRKGLQIPAQYYIERGYPPELLDEYDVGYSRRHNRVLVPMYDEDYKKVLGWAGRSLWEKCESCRMCHESGTPCPEGHEIRYHAKWLCSKDFRDKDYLYNYWKSNKHIRLSRCIVLVEGAGDVWRMEEAGIPNSVALMGSEIRGAQKIILEQCGASNCLVVPDRDKAGEEMLRQFHGQCGTFMNVVSLEIPAKDVGEMTAEAVREHVLPVVRKYSVKGTV